MPQYLADRCWLAALARVVPQVRDLRAVALDRLRVVQQVENAGAVAELEARVREVVVGIGLRRRAGALQLLHGLLEEWQRALVVAGAHLRVARVVQLRPARGRRSLAGRSLCRGSRRLRRRGRLGRRRGLRRRGGLRDGLHARLALRGDRPDDRLLPSLLAVTARRQDGERDTAAEQRDERERS